MTRTCARCRGALAASSSPQPLLQRLLRPPARRPRRPRAPRLRERPHPSTTAADRHRRHVSTSAVMTRPTTSCFHLGCSSSSAGTRRSISEPHPPLRVRARLACAGYAGSYRWSRHSRHVRATDYFIAAVAGSCSSHHLTTALARTLRPKIESRVVTTVHGMHVTGELRSPRDVETIEDGHQVIDSKSYKVSGTAAAAMNKSRPRM